MISMITPTRVPFRVLISLLITYLLSPPTLQVSYHNKEITFTSCDRPRRAASKQRRSALEHQAPKMA